MMTKIELIHACGAPAGEVDEELAPACINSGFYAEAPGLPLPIFQDNSERPCLTCPREVIEAARLGVNNLIDVEIPKGCYFENKLSESLGGSNG